MMAANELYDEIVSSTIFPFEGRRISILEIIEVMSEDKVARNEFVLRSREKKEFRVSTRQSPDI